MHKRSFSAIYGFVCRSSYVLVGVYICSYYLFQDGTNAGVIAKMNLFFALY